jgi:hypothetical protein
MGVKMGVTSTLKPRHYWMMWVDVGKTPKQIIRT